MRAYNRGFFLIFLCSFIFPLNFYHFLVVPVIFCHSIRPVILKMNFCLQLISEYHIWYHKFILLLENFLGLRRVSRGFNWSISAFICPEMFFCSQLIRFYMQFKYKYWIPKLSLIHQNYFSNRRFIFSFYQYDQSLHWIINRLLTNKLHLLNVQKFPLGLKCNLIQSIF